MKNKINSIIEKVRNCEPLRVYGEVYEVTGLTIKLRSSIFSRRNFNHLDINGDTRLYYLALQNITVLDNIISRKMTLLEQLNKIAQEKLQIWQKSKEQLEIMKKLREKQFNQYKREMDLEEQKFQAENFISRLKRGKNEKKGFLI